MTKEPTMIEVYQAPELVLIGMAQDLILGSACGAYDADCQTRSQSMGCP